MPTTTEEKSNSRREKAFELGDRIRAATADTPVEVRLTTSQRIIARVTDGIYREPWAAFRELCANAYDADATEVVIETGAPTFDQVTIRDNGRGMSPDVLAWVVENIGGSSKRTADGVILETANPQDPDLSLSGRPLIGKIGIGLFAVAQLTQHFQIITKVAGEDCRSWATVILKTHNESALKDESEERVWEAGRAKIVSERVADHELGSHGTTIVLHNLRPEIRSMLQSVPRWAASKQDSAGSEALNTPPKYHIGFVGAEGHPESSVPANLPWRPGVTPGERFKQLVAAAGETSTIAKTASTLEHLDNYLQSIWKLSLSLPLKYIGEHPFDISGGDGLITLDVPERGRAANDLALDDRETLRGRLGLTSGHLDPAGGFEVLFDGVGLSRPIELPTTLRRKSRMPSPVIMAAKVTAPFPEETLERAGGVLKFEAYLYWNSTISPKDIQGATIRVREASGTLFDRRFLDYQTSELTRLSQVTAEIFVIDGLDGAINIDRESFNYSHPHYIFIKRWLHRALRLLFNRLKSVAKEDLTKQKQENRAANEAAVVATAMGVWDEVQGEEADPPAILNHRNASTGQVAYHVPHWLDDVAQDEIPTATALGVVLEAYGLLDAVPVSRHGALIESILQVFRVAR